LPIGLVDSNKSSMTRILTTLASLSLLLMAAALVTGLAIGDLYAQPVASDETSRWATVSVIVTYFIGTSRWCREVVESYHLDRALVVNSNRLKRRTFPLAVIGMLAAVGIVALGGAADPATLRSNTAAWVGWHLVGAIGGILLIAWTYVVAWNNIFAHHAIIEQIAAQVAAARRERGLDS
jgi:hypothetical protein